MNQFDILIGLPTSLACGILRDWLSLKIVAALNIAYCSKANRCLFEALLQSDEYFVREEVTLLKNNGRLCDIWNRLPKFGRMLRSVVFQRELSEAAGRFVAQHCNNLTHVNFERQGSISALCIVLEANKKIEHMCLRLYMLYRMPDTQVLIREGMSLPKLRALAMMGSGFAHENIIQTLKMSNNISQLHIVGSKVNESIILQIALSCSSLQSLGLPGAELTDTSLSQLTASCPHIKHLDLRNTGLTDAAMLAVMQNLKGLKYLNIAENRNLTDAGLVHIYTHCVNTLETLYMDCRLEDGVGNLYGATAVHELLERCTKLRTFCFGYCDISDNAIDSGITIPAATLANLTELVLYGDIANARNLSAISRYGTNLTTLGFYDEMDVCTQAAWMGLFTRCTKLTGLYVGVDTRDVVSSWAENRPEVIVGASLPLHLLHLDVLNM